MRTVGNPLLGTKMMHDERKMTPTKMDQEINQYMHGR